MQKRQFYEKPTDASRVKQRIVTKYFGAWKNVLKTWRNAPRLGYVDLYAGPGVYTDGSPSTPLLVLQQAIDDEDLAGKLVAIFNDGDPLLAGALRANIADLQGIQRLRDQPQVYEDEVSATVIGRAPRIPTLLFADPWGYKGLSLALIESFLSTGGSDCIFFFNYNRINAGLGWKGFDEPLDLVFGHARAENLRGRVQGLTPPQRERVIIAEMQDALKEIGARCALPFRFISANADRTSHHLLFASKHQKGCMIMKDVMRDHSSAMVQGFGCFEFDGRTHSAEQMTIPGLGPLDELMAELIEHFAGRTMTLSALLAQHDHPVAAERNYKDAILRLEAAGKVSVAVPGRQRRRHGEGWTLPKDSRITFLTKGEG